MTTMTRVQAEALTAFIVRLRTDWRPVGVLAALEKAAPTADMYDVARALVNLAAEPTVQTPGLLDKPGPHWRKPDGETPTRRGDHDIRCPEHPQHFHPCGECRAVKCPPPEDVLQVMRQAVREGALKVRPGVETKPRTPPAEELARARARADREVQS